MLAAKAFKSIKPESSLAPGGPPTPGLDTFAVNMSSEKMAEFGSAAIGELVIGLDEADATAAAAALTASGAADIPPPPADPPVVTDVATTGAG